MEKVQSQNLDTFNAFLHKNSLNLGAVPPLEGKALIYARLKISIVT